ncbi:MAG: 2-succinyl-5-enolpyruvyl-6-hydroxy-3-cyclohexene-1-carboxylic-acid synthase [Micropruina sp.]
MSSSRCAGTIVAQLCAQGATDVVLASGSRSAPLALALARAETDGRLRLHVRFDERSAGFLALGLAKASGRPVPVLTTSGTAVGNLLPAVMEAHHSGVPLLVISADRPAALVGVGANQTTDQVRLFQPFVRWSARVASTAAPPSWAAQTARGYLLAEGAGTGNPGPVHLNVELDLPLVGDEAPLPTVAAVLRAPAGAPAAVALPVGPRTVVVCGDASVETGRQASALACAGGFPLVGEPSSNARGAALRTGSLLLGSVLAAEVERVVVFGHPTLSRPVNRLLARDDVEIIVVSAAPEWPDAGWRASRVVAALEADSRDESGWLSRWQAADALVSARADELVAAQPELTGPAVAAAVVASVGAGVLMLGNSQPIRDADLAAACPLAEDRSTRGGSEPTRAPDPAAVPTVMPDSSGSDTDQSTRGADLVCGAARVFANRGLAGIDGTVSTAVGVALASGEPVTLLCGDLTFLHDGNGLAAGLGERRPDLRIVVADDSGGSIFATLEYGDVRYADSFERVFGTPPGIDPVRLAEAHGVPVTRVGDEAGLTAALRRPIRGLDVVVATIDRTGRRALNTQLNALANQI